MNAYCPQCKSSDVVLNRKFERLNTLGEKYTVNEFACNQCNIRFMASDSELQRRSRMVRRDRRENK